MSKPALSTAGAVPVRNEKGEFSMQKVKVQRYVSGVKPNFTGDTSSEESDEDGFIRTDVIRKGPTKREVDIEEVEADFTAVNVEDDFTEDVSKLDRRLQRLQRLKQESSEERHVSDPEVIDPGQSEVRRQRHVRYEASDSENEDLPDDDEEEDEVERRHAALRKKLLMEDFDGLESKNERLIEYADRDHNEDEDDEEDDEEDSDDDEYESEDDTGPRLKPVFVRKQDRASLIRQREEEDRKTKEQEEEAEKLAKERHKIALKMIEVSVQQEVQQQNDDNQDISAETIAAVKTDDESEEIAYLNWKVRELQRNKRDKEEREELIRQKEEVERLRNMTEEERLEELRQNPKVVVNKADKGKFKFMQKYYHRGVFFMDKEEDLYKRDYTAPTLEDHFDKAILPKVMQVKNFGLAGRTKYTHLVDQDTTKFDSPWATNSAQTNKFYSKHAAGMKQEFERPSKKRRD